MSNEPDTGEGTIDMVEDATEEPDIVTPVLVDLGKVKRKHVKRLKHSEGRLVAEVFDVLDEVVEELGDDLKGATLVPVVMIYERKRKKQRRRTIELPF
jgi:hypothetical protein